MNDVIVVVSIAALLALGVLLVVKAAGVRRQSSPDKPKGVKRYDSAGVVYFDEVETDEREENNTPGGLG